MDGILYTWYVYIIKSIYNAQPSDEECLVI